MNVMQLDFEEEQGKVEGVYYNAGKGTHLIIIINGHNGFYNYGMFPFIQRSLYQNNISSYSFNFSHGGVIGDKDVFDDLAKYQKNCMRLEIADVRAIMKSHAFDNHKQFLLLAHSLGGVPAIFSTANFSKQRREITGLILVSSVSTLNFWPQSMLDEWKKLKVFYKINNRTKQALPQGEEFLTEILNHDSTWNVLNKVSSLQIPILIVHGEMDEAVPMIHAERLLMAAGENNSRVTKVIIAGATHTYNTVHPFVEPSSELLSLINQIVQWVHKLS